MFTSRSSKKSLLGSTLALMVLSFAFSAHAETTLKIGWPTADSPDDPYAIAAHYLAEEVNRLAPNQYKFQFFPSTQLGNEAEMVQGLRLGTIDLTVSTTSAVGSVAPSFYLNDLPFLYKTAEQARAVLDGKAGELMFAQLEKKGVIGLGFAESGFRSVLNNKRPVNSAADLSGMKLRVQPTEMFLDSFKAMGANPIPMAWGDVFTSLQQGTIDGLELPLLVIYANKFQDITKYLSLTQHTYNADALLMSGVTWKKLGAAQQKIFKQAAKTAIERQRATVAQKNSEILNTFKTKTKMAVNEVADMESLRKKVDPIYKKYEKVVGKDVIDAARAEMSKSN